MRKDVWKDNWIKIETLETKTGQGRTYKSCRIDSADRAVTHVLKILKQQDNKDRRGRMHSEVAAIERLEHPGIPRFADTNLARWNDDEELFLVTEYIPGKTLRQYVGSSPAPLEVAVRVSQKLLDILEYCHDTGVVHRDIKPDNIILRDDNPSDPVLIDFGLAYDEETRPDHFATPVWEHLGNRFYALPEYRIAGADNRNAVSDITLVVAILFYLLTGIDPEAPLDDSNRPPHKRPNAQERLQKLIEPQQAVLRTIFDVGFEVDRIQRWTSITSLRHEILRLASASGDSLPKRSFEEQIREVSTQFCETPTHVVSKRIATLGEGFQQVAIDVNKRAMETALGEFRLVHGLLPGVPNGTRFAKGFSFVHKYDPTITLNIVLYARVEGGEFLVLAVENKVVEEVARVRLFDPDALAALKAGIENCYVERLRRLLH